MPSDIDGFMSIADAATVLFVSRPHVRKLLESGALELHHETKDGQFVVAASVHSYKTARQAAIDAYNALSADE
ncbi:hypothetical protein [Caballeronia sp. LZ032]|uniref:hypothetical protein n=1 Tax=Caballeronia sp. LZ032 TaxID=3038565 RepID=UPI00285C55EB|nr:hypothetical protein [Caballeronia sp. LZ032]MDR5879426.1 hypothetical protein [Caballeronia sp. LZ032]